MQLAEMGFGGQSAVPGSCYQGRHTEDEAEPARGWSVYSRHLRSSHQDRTWTATSPFLKLSVFDTVLFSTRNEGSCNIKCQ